MVRTVIIPNQFISKYEDKGNTFVGICKALCENYYPNWLLTKLKYNANAIVGSVVEWLKCRVHDQHSLGSKHTRVILLCPWERRFTALSPAWWFGKQF